MTKTPEETAAGILAGNARMIAKGGALMWANVLAHAVLKVAESGKDTSVDNLIHRIGMDADGRDELTKAGSNEAISRLREAVAKGIR
ncbi:MAG: hypothetical protein DI537_11150 [Stutzerimonas stutzeri]|uniref:Uncharacterized protein n=1 Tax=Bosea eneae TaxID=151454 RepID=A0ABW0ITR7_9HYPH|nr:MAG: hypothetical protein DI537_11150 [Stutzerimonas stutzeri]